MKKKQLWWKQRMLSKGWSSVQRPSWAHTLLGPALYSGSVPAYVKAMCSIIWGGQCWFYTKTPAGITKTDKQQELCLAHKTEICLLWLINITRCPKNRQCLTEKCFNEDQVNNNNKEATLAGRVKLCQKAIITITGKDFFKYLFN